MEELLKQVNGAFEDLTGCELQGGRACGTCYHDAVRRLSRVLELLEPQVVEGDSCPWPREQSEGVTF